MSTKALRAGMYGVAGLVVVVANLVGCGAADPAIPTEVEVEGQTYDLTPSGEPAGSESGAPPTTAPLVMRADELSLEPALRSRDALADDLRPVLGHANGEVYIAREPNRELADAILERETETGPVAPQPLSEGADRSEETIAQIEQPIIFGSDGRRRRNTDRNPNHSIARLILFKGTQKLGKCTGMYIGSRTVLTAAHCIRLRNGTVVNRIKFQRAKDGGYMPGGTIDCRRDDSNGSNNFSWFMPSAWYYDEDFRYDFAVIDTEPCHSSPRQFSGYYINPGDARYTMAGYGKTCPGVTNGNDVQCGMSGAANVNDVFLETTAIDGEDGQSGSPWYRYVSGGYYVHGVHGGSLQYFDFGKCGFDVCRRNVARRIDSAMSDLIRQGSAEF